MNNNLQGFDPLLFLGITNLQGEEKTVVSKELLDKISRYITVRIGELLSMDDLKEINGDPERLFSAAKEKIPDFDNKMKMFLNDYKTEFQNNLSDKTV